MPPRTIEESHRPRASDRTMHCHSSSGQSYWLVVSENDGRRHNSQMEPQGRTIDSPFRTRRQSKTLCLEKATLRVRDYVQTVGLNAETKKDRHRAEGEIFVLTFPFIGLTGFRCRLRRSTQHLLAVYSQESRILKFFSGVGSSAARPGRAALESRQTGRFPWGSIALEGGLCFRSCLAARDFADHRSRPSRPWPL